MAGCGPNDRTPPLIGAIGSRDVEQVRTELGRGADPNERDGLGFTPLNAAAQGGDVAIVKLLLKSGAVITKNGPGHWSPIMSAINPEVVQALVDSGADVCGRTTASPFKGMSALEIAKQRNQTAIVELLTPLVRACPSTG
jgi:ankyrin repeat protein